MKPYKYEDDELRGYQDRSRRSKISNIINLEPISEYDKQKKYEFLNIYGSDMSRYRRYEGEKCIISLFQRRRKEKYMTRENAIQPPQFTYAKRKGKKQIKENTKG